MNEDSRASRDNYSPITGSITGYPAEARVGNNQRKSYEVVEQASKHNSQGNSHLKPHNEPSVKYQKNSKERFLFICSQCKKSFPSRSDANLRAHETCEHMDMIYGKEKERRILKQGVRVAFCFFPQCVGITFNSKDNAKARREHRKTHLLRAGLYADQRKSAIIGARRVFRSCTKCGEKLKDSDHAQELHDKITHYELWQERKVAEFKLQSYNGTEYTHSIWVDGAEQKIVRDDNDKWEDSEEEGRNEHDGGLDDVFGGGVVTVTMRRVRAVRAVMTGIDMEYHHYQDVVLRASAIN